MTVREILEIVAGIIVALAALVGGTKFHDWQGRMSEKIATLHSNFTELAQLVSNISETMLAHHRDSDAHRNKDFERIITSLSENIAALAKDQKAASDENRNDHKEIMTMIRNGAGK